MVWSKVTASFVHLQAVLPPCCPVENSTDLASLPSYVTVVFPLIIVNANGDTNLLFPVASRVSSDTTPLAEIAIVKVCAGKL